MKFGYLLGALALFMGAQDAWAATATASSELVDEEKVRHRASNAFDGLLTTAWAEGEDGDGVGAYLELRFDRTTDVESISIWPGDLRQGKRSLRENGRPHTVTVTLNTADGPVSTQARIRDGAEQGPRRIDVDISGAARSVRITIDEAYSGYLRDDLYIAEVGVNVAKGAPHSGIIDVETWMNGSSGIRATEAHEAKVASLVEQIRLAEFGDRDALATLGEWAADGAPYRRDIVRRYVPMGFRVAATPPDTNSVDALQMIQDANAIPYLRLASLRVTGKQQRRLDKIVSYFEAFASLNSGGRRSLPLWGTEGWERGALQSFGEPMPISVGQYGDVYVADVANNRISVFSVRGSIRAEYGEGEPTITNSWFGKKRPYYVSGKTPSEADTGFTQPLDLVTIPVKEGEELIVLDAAGKVRWLDENGKPLRSWQVTIDGPVSPGVGGEAHLTLVKGKVVVAWGNEGFVFDKDGNELSRWDISDGVPIDILGLKNGKVLMAFANKGVIYGLDGFRLQTVIGDDLPRGCELWTMAFDEKGKLWAITDNGWAVKYKKPGVVDYQVRWSELPVGSPSFAVREDLLTLLVNGEIQRVDALELKANAEGGEE